MKKIALFRKDVDTAKAVITAWLNTSLKKKAGNPEPLKFRLRRRHPST